MPKLVLLVEDKTEEIEKAKAALAEVGVKPALARTYTEAKTIWAALGANLAGVITDLHFPEREGRDSKLPCGIAIAVQAREENVPVVICTNVNHHNCEYLWHTWVILKIPTSETKDWRWAAETLDSLIVKGDQS